MTFNPQASLFVLISPYQRNNPMTEMIMSSKTAAIHWADVIEYPQTGVKSKILLEDANCRYTLMMLGVGMHIAEHTNPRNATVNVIEGEGVFTLEGEELVLETGVFIFVSVPGVQKIDGLKRTRSSTVEEWNLKALR